MGYQHVAKEQAQTKYERSTSDCSDTNYDSDKSSKMYKTLNEITMISKNFLCMPVNDISKYNVIRDRLKSRTHTFCIAQEELMANIQKEWDY